MLSRPAISKKKYPRVYKSVPSYKTSYKTFYTQFIKVCETIAMSENLAIPEGSIAQRRLEVCIAEAKNNTRREIIRDFKGLLDENKSIRLRRDGFQKYVKNVSRILDLAIKIQGFKIDETQSEVKCPVVVVGESSDLEIAASSFNVTFGTDQERSKMMTTKKIKEDILSKMQMVSPMDISKDPCQAVIVGLKDIECLVMIPLQDTKLRARDIEQERPRNPDTGLLPNETKALRRCVGILIGLEEWIHSFDSNTIYGFRTNVVIGHSQKISQSQVYVPKLLWRGMFQSHETLMTDDLFDRVFQPRSKKRKSPTSSETKTETQKEDEGTTSKHPSTGGKHPSMLQIGKHPTTSQKVITQETVVSADDVQERLEAKLNERHQTMEPETLEYLLRFVCEFRDVVHDSDYVSELHESMMSDDPETTLKETIQSIFEDPEFKEFASTF
jgi:hypothetical protein